MPQLWEKSPTETSKAFQAFCVYRDLGPSRSQEKVVGELRKSIQLVSRWCRRHSWVKRAAAYDEFLDEQRRELVARGQAAMVLRQANDAMLMQEFAMAALRNKNAADVSVSVACRLFEIAARIEREIRGHDESDRVTKLQVNFYPESASDCRPDSDPAFRTTH